MAHTERRPNKYQGAGLPAKKELEALLNSSGVLPNAK
jgi:hypothetical protein